MEQKQKKSNYAKVIVLVISLVVLGVSASYAFFYTTIKGDTSTTTIQAGKLTIETNLDSKNAISNEHLNFIKETEKESKADKISFTVSNKSDSNVSGKYNVFLKEINLTKNLYSSYFKWELLRGRTVIGSGNFSDATRSDAEISGEDERVSTTANDIKLTTDEIILNPNMTDTLTFRMYLVNDDAVNQISLTEGSFTGKLFIQAVPISNNN